MIVIFIGMKQEYKAKSITETITDYLEELTASFQCNYLMLSHFHYQSCSVSNVKNHTTLKNNW